MNHYDFKTNSSNYPQVLEEVSFPQREMSEEEMKVDELAEPIIFSEADIADLEKLKKEVLSTFKLIEEPLKLPCSETCQLNIQKGIKEYSKFISEDELQELEESKILTDFLKKTRDIVLCVQEFKFADLDRKDLVFSRKEEVKKWLVYYWALIYLPQHVACKNLLSSYLSDSFFQDLTTMGALVEDQFGSMLSIDLLNAFLSHFEKDDAELTVVSIGSCGIPAQQLLPSIPEAAAQNPTKKITVFLVDDFSCDESLIVLDKKQWLQTDKEEWKHREWSNLTVRVYNGELPLIDSAVSKKFFSKFKEILQEKLQSENKVIISQHTGSSVINSKFFPFLKLFKGENLLLIGQSGFPPIVYNHTHDLGSYQMDQLFIKELFFPSSDPVVGWEAPLEERIERTISNFKKLFIELEPEIKKEELAEALNECREEINQFLTTRVRFSLKEVDVLKLLH